MITGKTTQTPDDYLIDSGIATFVILNKAEIVSVWMHEGTKEFYAELQDGSFKEMNDQELKSWLL